MSLIVCENVSYSLVQFGNKIDIINNINLSLEPATITTMIGPNGAGKTTLLKLVLGLLTPTHGVVKRKADLSMGYVPQKLAQNAYLPMNVKNFIQLMTKAPLKDICTQLNVDALLEKSLDTLSGGELQRVLIVAALARQPDILILDEPAQGIDVEGQSQFYEILEHVRSHHQCAVLMVSHDLHIVMAKTNQVICLNHHICCHGAPDDIRQDPSSLPFLSHFAPYTHHHDHSHAH